MRSCRWVGGGGLAGSGGLEAVTSGWGSFARAGSLRLRASSSSALRSGFLATAPSLTRERAEMLEFTSRVPGVHGFLELLLDREIALDDAPGRRVRHRFRLDVRRDLRRRPRPPLARFAATTATSSLLLEAMPQVRALPSSPRRTTTALGSFLPDAVAECPRNLRISPLRNVSDKRRAALSFSRMPLRGRSAGF